MKPDALPPLDALVKRSLRGFVVGFGAGLLGIAAAAFADPAPSNLAGGLILTGLLICTGSTIVGVFGAVRSILRRSR